MHYFRQLVLGFMVFLFLPPLSFAQDIQLNRKEIVRNGDFNNADFDSWYTSRCEFESAGQDGTSCMTMPGGDWVQVDDYAFQMVSIPSILKAATLRFDYNAIVATAYEKFPVVFKIAFAESRTFDGSDLFGKALPVDIIDEVFSKEIDAESDWQTVEYDLDQELISKIQAAHDDKKYVFLVLMQLRTDSENEHGYETHIDNLSLKVDGIQKVHDMQGQIAYLEELEKGDPHAINLLDPNTGQSTTIWNHPDGRFDGKSCLAWSPDASRLAFTSDQHVLFSIFNSDIYTIRPDGSGLRRIPNTPSQQELETYPHVTVNGTLNIDAGTTGDYFNITLGVQGTNSYVTVQGSSQDSVPFTIPDVPVLGDPATFHQTLIMKWFSADCDGGFGFAYPNAPVTGKSVNIGQVNFIATNCVGAYTFKPRELSWKYDGTEIGFYLTGLYKVNVNATQEFEISPLEPSNPLSTGLAWSPVDDRYLYIDYTMSTNNNIYLAKEGGTGTLLLEDVSAVPPVWLPDGSGFIYVSEGIPHALFGDDDNIYQYDLDSKKITRLTWFSDESVEHVSISPDGRYIVFQQESGILPPHKSDLWILDRLNPVEMWKLTDSGNYLYPVWSPRDPVVLDDDPAGDPDDGDVDSADDSDSGSSGGGGSGGGGGCFISTCR